MKNILYIMTLVLFTYSCGGTDDSMALDPIPSPTESTVNKAPSVPVQATPTNNQLCIDSNVSFSWSASTDPDGDTVSYELQIATDNLFKENTQSLTNTSTNLSIPLEKGVAYYWRIKAKDSKNESSNYSSTYNFFTEGEAISNHLPFSPALVVPEMNSIVPDSAFDLKWTASDVDGDTLTYDVYFGTVNPPTDTVAEGIAETAFNQALESSKNYYWKVVVKDDKGGITNGQIWSFKTD